MFTKLNHIVSGCLTQIQHCYKSLRWNLRDFFADQTDHGASLADDLHVMQPWGRRCNGDVKGRLPERMIEM